MSKLNALADKIGDFGKDARLNLQSVPTLEGAPGLTETQISGTALACAYALSNTELVSVFGENTDSAVVLAAQKAATIMAMNNVYYRTLHLLGDAELSLRPARLRMSAIGSPGIAKPDFELMSFAVSALAGCGMCLSAHLIELRKAGVNEEGIQSALRIASVLKSADTALKIAGE